LDAQWSNGVGHPVDNSGTKRLNQGEGQHRHDEDGEKRQPDDAPDATHDVRCANPLRSPTGFPLPYPEDAIEESTVPGQRNDQRFVESVAAAAAEVPDRIIAFAALAADQVARMSPGRRLEAAGGGPGARDRRRD